MPIALTVLTPLLAFGGALLGVLLGVIQLAALDEITHLDGYERAMVRAALDTVEAAEPGGEEEA